MESKPAPTPKSVFLLLPQKVFNVQSGLKTTAFAKKTGIEHFLLTEMRIMGAIQVLIGLMNFCFGAVFIFTRVSPYPRFPFIFITGYPFWGAACYINSGSLLIAFERRTTRYLGQVSLIGNTVSSVAALVGIVLLAFGLVLDKNYLCGYVGGGTICAGISIILTGILGMMMVFAVLELLISLSYSVFRHNLTCAESEDWFSIEV
ncbi:membrane-spanning 4-domains subfamily A member 5-like [Antechinus flavipes]|uniref:Membrane spanning 4-domains A5 n=1 Tax=Sarcophilus harrisii TaxID=9305 RepID=A0A7N4NUX3_SARHA|nr:membrane-spanning 4-domains subfamily A member 5 [Sarcophilus harrisii]XP_051820573.1 membrane-spanning 4-domains subfamily A member 5-like [Antechinus flavipes]